MWARLKPRPRLSRRARRGLRIGTRIEKEHVYSKRAAAAIAAQHLAERPDYYRRLMKYVENPGRIQAGATPFKMHAAIRKLQDYAEKEQGLELTYAQAKEALERMVVAEAHRRMKVVPGGRMVANPRHVFGGMVDLMPTTGRTEPKHITGLRLGKNKVLLCFVGHFKVYEVDGMHIRNQWADFIAGGNPEAYQFVPKGEIWVDTGLKYHWDKVCIAWHEIIETLLMKHKGWTYMKAHHAANIAEQELRQHDRRQAGLECFQRVVLGCLMDHFGQNNLEKLVPMAYDIARGLHKI